MPEIPEFEVTGSSELNSDFDELGLGSSFKRILENWPISQFIEGKTTTIVIFTQIL